MISLERNELGGYDILEGVMPPSEKGKKKEPILTIYRMNDDFQIQEIDEIKTGLNGDYIAVLSSGEYKIINNSLFNKFWEIVQ